MSDEIVKVGRKDILLDEVKSAVANAKFYRDICRDLGFKEGSTLTIKKAIEKYKLDASHIRPYSFTEDEIENRSKRNTKAFNLSDDNQIYYNAFGQSFQNKESWQTYKATIGSFLENLCGNDFAAVSVDEIYTFVGNSKNKASHLKSFVIFLAHNNINNCYDKFSKDILFWTIPAPPQTFVLNDEPVFPDEIDPSDAKIMEGSITATFVNKYERDPNARRQCIKEHGTICSVCQKRLSDIYGEMFSDKIHVHHLNPMCKYDGEHEIDAKNELKPVCPNCHMIIHCRKDTPYSIEEVKAFIEECQDNI